MDIQFRSKFIFYLLAGTMFLNKSLCWFYNEGNHDQVLMDDVSKTIKNIISKKLSQARVWSIHPKNLMMLPWNLCHLSVYLPKSYEIVEVERIHQAPSIPETLLIHKFVRQINDRGDCSIECFKMVVNEETFHIQWYKRARDVVCGNEKFNKAVQCAGNGI